MERGRRFRVARNRAFNLVSKKQARAVRGKFPEAAHVLEIIGRASARVAGKCGSVSVEFARGISARFEKRENERAAKSAGEHRRAAGAVCVATPGKFVA